jgi:hypothetical protein
LALLSNGTVAAWGDGDDGDTNIPSGLTNVVAIAAGSSHNLALLSNGTVVAWGLNDFGQCNVPAGLSNVMAIAAGEYHSVALKNDGTVVAWGDNTSGQANVPNELPTAVPTEVPNSSPPSFTTTYYSPIVVKYIAAGGYHTIAAIFSQSVQYPVNISKDLLLIYNSNSLDSSNVCQYYLTHRPMVTTANVLGIGCTTNAVISPAGFTNNFMIPVQNWLSNNPTIRPLYVVLFQDLPQEVNPYTTNYEVNNGDPSVQYQLHNWTALGWSPFVTSINMNGTSSTNYFSSDGTNDCIAYINKLTNMAAGNPPGTLFISATAGGYGNSNWYFDQDSYGFGSNAAAGVLSVDPSASIFGFTSPSFTTNATNVAGYYTCGVDCNPAFTPGFATNGAIQFFGNSGWYIMSTVDSFNGQRVPSFSPQWSFLTWFATNAFDGTNYSNTPVGAVVHVNEPDSTGQENRYIYFGDWAAGKSFAISAWDALIGNPLGDYTECAVVGDPFTRK